MTKIREVWILSPHYTLQKAARSDLPGKHFKKKKIIALFLENLWFYHLRQARTWWAASREDCCLGPRGKPSAPGQQHGVPVVSTHLAPIMGV